MGTHLEYLLTKKAGVLQLEFPAETKIKPMVVDFFSPGLQYRYLHGGGVRQTLARAVGIKAGYRPKVLDATAGFGVDAIIIARLGCEVLMLERSPIIHALLADGLKRARSNPEFKKIKLSLKKADALVYLDKLGKKLNKPIKPAFATTLANDLPDVIYLDPMYPERRKSALNKIEMRVLREVVGEDLDADKLFEQALQCAQKRVVVKRPRLGVSLGLLKPDLKFVGKSGRFDVYLVKN
jgi:16S rRNA (guanine1516-N2)-methyltransferase